MADDDTVQKKKKNKSVHSADNQWNKRLTAAQLAVLESEFDQKHNPTSEEITAITSKAGMLPEQVYKVRNWFRNRRLKHSRNVRGLPPRKKEDRMDKGAGDPLQEQDHISSDDLTEDMDYLINEQFIQEELLHNKGERQTYTPLTSPNKEKASTSATKVTRRTFHSSLNSSEGSGEENHTASVTLKRHRKGRFSRTNDITTKHVSSESFSVNRTEDASDHSRDDNEEDDLVLSGFPVPSAYRSRDTVQTVSTRDKSSVLDKSETNSTTATASERNSGRRQRSSDGDQISPVNPRKRRYSGIDSLADRAHRFTREQYDILESYYMKNPKKQLTNEEVFQISQMIKSDDLVRIRTWYRNHYYGIRNGKRSKIRQKFLGDGITSEARQDHVRNEQKYVVEEVLDGRINNHDIQLLVKWKDFSPSWNSWEFCKNLVFDSSMKKFVLSNLSLFRQVLDKPESISADVFPSEA